MDSWDQPPPGGLPLKKALLAFTSPDLHKALEVARKCLEEYGALPERLQKSAKVDEFRFGDATHRDRYRRQWLDRKAPLDKAVSDARKDIDLDWWTEWVDGGYELIGREVRASAALTHVPMSVSNEVAWRDEDGQKILLRRSAKIDWQKSTLEAGGTVYWDVWVYRRGTLPARGPLGLPASGRGRTKQTDLALDFLMSSEAKAIEEKGGRGWKAAQARLLEKRNPKIGDAKRVLTTARKVGGVGSR